MKRIMLVCSSGMSTSLLVVRMQAAAKNRGIEVEVFAASEADAKNRFDEVDVLLLGPQVRYLLSKMQGLAAPKGVLVHVIDSADYGAMNGDKVLAQALRLLKGVRAGGRTVS